MLCAQVHALAHARVHVKALGMAGGAPCPTALHASSVRFSLLARVRSSPSSGAGLLCGTGNHLVLLSAGHLHQHIQGGVHEGHAPGQLSAWRCARHVGEEKPTFAEGSAEQMTDIRPTPPIPIPSLK